MKRLLVLTVLSLTAVFLATSFAVGAGPSKSSTSSKVSPTRDKKKPYKFKVSGTIKFPTSFCAPNAPQSGCLPLTCPAGVTNAQYCTKPTLAQVCTGTVKITFKKGSSTRGSKTATVSKTTCKYKATVKVSRKGRMKVSAKFSGNTILSASSASKKNARAG